MMTVLTTRADDKTAPQYVVNDKLRDCAAAVKTRDGHWHKKYMAQSNCPGKD